MWGIVIVVSGTEIAGAVGSVDGGGTFSASDIVSGSFGGAEGVLEALGLLRRAQTESMSMVAPVVLAIGLSLDSFL